MNNIFRWVALISGSLLFMAAITDLYNWLAIATKPGKTIPEILEEYYKSFPASIKQRSMSGTMYFIRIGNIVITAMSVFLFVVARPLFRQNHAIAVFKILIIASACSIFLQLLMMA